MTLEEFLTNRGKIQIVGGSTLFSDHIPDAISINGFREGCSIAAVNGNRSDLRRCNGKFDILIAPNSKKRLPDSVIVPENKVVLPKDFPGRGPTTYFSLALICDSLNLPTQIYGVCGLASKYHYGDWEMYYMKHKMKHITIHDPRPKW